MLNSLVNIRVINKGTWMSAFGKNKFLRSIWFSVHLFDQIRMQLSFKYLQAFMTLTSMIRGDMNLYQCNVSASQLVKYQSLSELLLSKKTYSFVPNCGDGVRWNYKFRGKNPRVNLVVTRKWPKNNTHSFSRNLDNFPPCAFYSQHLPLPPPHPCN